MSFAVVHMQKIKAPAMKGMQFHHQRERESKTNPDIDEERSDENYDLANEQNIDYNKRVKEIIESQKTGTRKTRKDAVLVNELLITSDEKFFKDLSRGEQNKFFEESYDLFSGRYGEQNVAYARVHLDEKTPHMHLGIVPMRDGRLQGKNVFNREELRWIQDEFPKHMQERGFNLERGEIGSTREHVATQDLKKQNLKKEIDVLQTNLDEKKRELSALNQEIPSEIKFSAKKLMKNVEVPTGEKSIFGKPKTKTEKKPTGNVVLSGQDYKELVAAARQKEQVKNQIDKILNTDYAKENKQLQARNTKLEKLSEKVLTENIELKTENDTLKAKLSRLTNEIENVYQTTRNFFKERTNDLQAFKSVLSGWVNKIKEKLPKSEIGRLHDRSEEKEKTFDMNRVRDLDKQAKKQRSVKKNKDKGLEL